MKKTLSIFAAFVVVLTLFWVSCGSADGEGPGEGVITRPPISDGNVGPRGSIHDNPADGIYVSPTGNDATADGSIDKPYKSINAALAAAQSGDTIILRGGTYREGINVRVRSSNITIKSALYFNTL
jgi:hypothetical protein